MIFTNLNGAQPNTLTAARSRGDWHDTAALLAQGRTWIIDRIKDSGLRGRGGAGFWTGLKWSFMPQDIQPERPHYLIVNADESEPGTCKDRALIRHEAHKIIEGALLAAKAVGAHTGYIYIRGEYAAEAQILQRAIDEAYAAGLIGADSCGSGYPFDLYIHRGAGAYICGEETALLESMEGKRGLPRLKPPYPAQYGLYGCPTTVNNVETLATVGTILRRGAQWFKDLGIHNNAGTKIFSLSGHVNTPCIIEAPLGTAFKELVNTHGGGVRGGWDNLQAIIPGGSSVPLLGKEICENLIMDFDHLKEAGSALGTGGIIVMDNSVNLIEVIIRFAEFYMHESCGQCSPCREGTGWLWRALQRLKDEPYAGQPEWELIGHVCEQLAGRTICSFGEAAAWPVQGLIRHLRALAA